MQNDLQIFDGLSVWFAKNSYLTNVIQFNSIKLYNEALRTFNLENPLKRTTHRWQTNSYARGIFLAHFIGEAIN